MPTPRVLVVDDNSLDRKLLTLNLAPEGYAIETATDGVEAWAMLHENPEKYDVVLVEAKDGLGAWR